jgi:hypothetical protein
MPTWKEVKTKQLKEIEHLDGSIEAAKAQDIKTVVAVLSLTEAQRVQANRRQTHKFLKTWLAEPDEDKPLEKVRMRDER